MKKPLVVTDIPNRKAMAQMALHLGYSSETVKQFRDMSPDQFPAYIEDYNPKNETFWGSNLAWVPEYRYEHVEYSKYIEEHHLKPRQHTKKEVQEWVDEKLVALSHEFAQYFPEQEALKHFLRNVSKL